MALSFIPVSAAERSNDYVACLESADGEFIAGYYSLRAAVDAIETDGQVVKLLKDTSMALHQVDGFGGWSVFGLIDKKNKSNSNDINISIILDLNGYTLTFGDYKGSQKMYGQTAIDFEKAVIKNGRIVFDYTPLADQGLFIYNYGIVASESLTCENLEIITNPNKRIFASIYLDRLKANVYLNNCTIDNNEEDIFRSIVDPPQYITINSGCYSNLDMDKVTLTENSRLCHIDNVDGTVIVSEDTEAIVVKENRAYTFDDLETANAAAADADDARLLERRGDEFAEINIDTGNTIVHVSSEDDLLAQMPGEDDESNVDIVLDNDMTVSSTVVISGGVLDLNGHTIIIKPSGNAAVSMVGGKIINGTIIIDYSGMEYPLYGVHSSGPVTALENVEIITAPATGLDAAVVIEGTAQIDNCVMTDITINENGSMFKSEEETDVNISSGNYKDLSHSGLNGQASSGTVSPAEGSNTVDVNGIDSTVIVSQDTGAMVVKDDKVYTYETVEDAKKNTDGNNAVLLEKTETGEFIGSTTEIEWIYATDSGYCMVADTKSGVIRFLFGTGINPAEVKTSGIKFTKSSDITENVSDSEYLSGAASAFYGDITDIPETDNSTYYAVAYVELTNGTVKWSDVVSCEPNFETIINCEEE